MPQEQKRNRPLRATISSEDGKKQVKCHFNPNEFEITGLVKWVERRSIGSDTPLMTFSGGEAEDMNIDLLFDTTDTGQDVRDTYRTLLELAQVDESTKNPKTQKGEPPRCRFQWGRFLAFTAVIKKITQKFTYFKSDGTPLRAKVTVTLTEVGKQVARQNPTSYSEPRKIWIVHQGDRLDWIAYREYGDPAHWRHIAVTNGLLNPLDLQPGQILKLVPLP